MDNPTLTVDSHGSQRSQGALSNVSVGAAAMKVDSDCDYAGGAELKTSALSVRDAIATQRCIEL